LKTKKNIIIEEITGLSKSQLFLNKKIPDRFKKKIETCYKRLDSGEPIEYIINKAEFYSLEFYIDNRCLIPRDDTEVMIEQVLKNIKEKAILIDV
jgi:release factor glutamine methyltransferase